MSEFSESLHFRHPIALNDDALREALAASKLRGVLLPPSNGWRTFVPFKSGPVTLKMERWNGAQLSVVVGVPVVEYHYAEDHFWFFHVWINADPMSGYSCNLQPTLPITDGEIEPVLLSTLLPADGSIEELLRLLLTPTLTQEEGRDRAKRFMRLLGITNAEYTGPHYIRDELEELRTREGCLVIENSPPKRRSRRKE